MSITNEWLMGTEQVVMTVNLNENVSLETFL